MSERKITPSLKSFLIPLFACLGTTLLVYPNVPKLPGALEGMGINDLTQVVVPGSAEVYFPKTGGYAVYYEFRSVVDGEHYVRNKYPPSLNCQLKSKASGANVALTPDYVEGNMYATDNEERVGVLMYSITIKNPGVYNFSCQYQDGLTSPQIALAVGPNIVWELFNVAAKPLGAMLCGGFVFTGALGVSILIVAIVAVKRNQTKKGLASHTESMVVKEGE